MAQAFVQIEHRPWRRNGRWMSMALGLVFAILLVQAISYSGLIERLAEWEFSRFGRYFPVLTIGALVGLFAAAWVAVVALRRRLTNRTAPPPSVPLDMGRLESARRILIALSLLAGAVALVGAVQYLRAPSMAATPHQIDLSRAGAVPLVDGPARIIGLQALGPIARQSDDLLFNRHTIYLVPVGRTRMEDGTDAFNLFVQSASPRAADLPLRATGMMRLDALPPDIEAMYRNAQIAVSPDSAVLFSDPSAATRPLAIMVGEAIIFGLIALVFAAYLKRRLRKLRESAQRSAMLEGTPTA